MKSTFSPSFAPGSTMDLMNDVHRVEKNRLLSRLSRAAYDTLMTHCETVQLTVHEVLYRPLEPIPYVHFPSSGVVSIVKILANGDMVEVMTIGYEGLVELPVILGGESAPLQALVQISGSAKRISASTFRSLDPLKSELHGVLGRYALGALNQVSQGVICNSLHSVQQRCARWLLMTHDRVGVDEFGLTHEFLASMLAVRRASVTDVEAELRRAGLISASRGKVRIVDRTGLEAVSCECYRAVQAEYDRLLG